MWRPGVVLVLALGLAAFGRADTKTAGVVSPTQQPLGSEYNYQNYPYYQQYYPNYQYSGGYNGVQKQDSGFLGNLLNFGSNSDSGFQGGNGGGFGGSDGGNDLSAMGSAAASVAAAIGIKGLLKIVFGALGVFVLLWLIPLALSIAAIVLATENNGGDGGAGGGIGDRMKDMMNWGSKGNRNVGRAMEALNHVFSSEQCIERISCSISRRAFGARKLSKKTAATAEATAQATAQTGKGRSKGDDVKPEGANRRDNTLMGRISRGLKSENCEAYQCRLASYFS